MTDWTIYLLLVAGLVASLLLAILQLPGLWLMVFITFAYIWATAGAHMGYAPLAVMIAIALVAEVLETLSTAQGARRVGASRTAMVLSMVGAVIGGIFLTFLPIPILGTLLGVCLGAFFGAAIGEVVRGRDPNQSLKSGLGAVAGRLVGTLVKLSLGCLMLLIAAIAAMPSGSNSSPAAALPASAPATAAVQLER